MTPIPSTPTELKRKELFEKYQGIKTQIEAIDQRILGLGFAPKELRREKFEALKMEREAKLQEEMAVREELRALA